MDAEWLALNMLRKISSSSESFQTERSRWTKHPKIMEISSIDSNLNAVKPIKQVDSFTMVKLDLKVSGFVLQVLEKSKAKLLAQKLVGMEPEVCQGSESNSLNAM